MALLHVVVQGRVPIDRSEKEDLERRIQEIVSGHGLLAKEAIEAARPPSSDSDDAAEMKKEEAAVMQRFVSVLFKPEPGPDAELTIVKIANSEGQMVDLEETRQKTASLLEEHLAKYYRMPAKVVFV